MLKFFLDKKNITHTNTHKQHTDRGEHQQEPGSVVQVEGEKRMNEAKKNRTINQNEKREKSGQFTLHSGTGIRIRCVLARFISRNKKKHTSKRGEEIHSARNVKSTKRSNNNTSISTVQNEWNIRVVQNEMMLLNKTQAKKKQKTKQSIPSTSL